MDSKEVKKHIKQSNLWILMEQFWSQRTISKKALLLCIILLSILTITNKLSHSSKNRLATKKNLMYKPKWNQTMGRNVSGIQFFDIAPLSILTTTKVLSWNHRYQRIQKIIVSEEFRFNLNPLLINSLTGEIVLSNKSKFLMFNMEGYKILY